ncbi:MAG: DNA (cytosine-5-)-methyltransferase [Streptosporangiaceae bacterium]|nr:DNA (cytosine-5-)-methyltransferase [Streptosporangiaceae bacterium]
MGLFAGIGGLELGFSHAGASTMLLCEVWPPAQAVLRERFPGVTVHGDIQELDELPPADVVSAGFPCTDLSQAGRTAGIHGQASGLVKHLFRLLSEAQPRWVVIENVRNMLVLDRGKAMDYLVHNLEELGFRWAYRLVDSRFTGVPQRRQRVLMVASRDEDPRDVLFADDAGEPDDSWFRDDAYGFYWTEGLGGLGWARDAVPTLKGGSTIGIPSAPAIWIRGEQPGEAMVTPSIADAERLQGFPVDWTSPALAHGRPGVRWKLAGNAVTVGVAAWLGGRLAVPGKQQLAQGVRLSSGDRWPVAAWGQQGQRWLAPVSMWPQRQPYQHLLDVVDRDGLTPLSRRAAEGFYGRMERSTLRFDEGFKLAMKKHVEVMRLAA